MESNTSGSKAFSWADVDWNALRNLRERFLAFDPRDSDYQAPKTQSADPDRSDYWTSHNVLTTYDFTLAERIGWKWDTVLAELKSRGWTPPTGTALDWGCGTGVAGRRVAGAWPETTSRLLLRDRSERARDYATERARQMFPGLTVQAALPGSVPDLLVLSHVINELSSGALDALFELAAKAQSILWVEPGTADASAKLVAARERLLKHFSPIAPCPHRDACPMRAPGNEQHWCHHFAQIPSHVHVDPGWGRFSERTGIDLGTLPFSFLVLDRRPVEVSAEPDLSRLIGRPRFYKGHAKALCCRADGLRELILTKRAVPELFKELRKAPGTLYRLERDGDNVTAGRRVF